MSASPVTPLGAVLHPDGTCSFCVWAPDAQRVHVELEGPGRLPLDLRDRGYHMCTVDGIEAGARYRFVIEPVLDSPSGAEPMSLPDPASRWQPDGVHGASAVHDPRFPWTDEGWAGVPLLDWILYELHVGTFTREGTFDAAIVQLDRLVALGITVIEVMPVAQFPGARNWGYDGVHPFAVQTTYGGPDSLKRFVDACHRRGLGVVLDVVYNHLGPEGNVLGHYGPYFDGSYQTPWGPAINFDGGGSDEVRRYFIDNALMWLEEFHVDGLRLDAVHGIVDTSPQPFLAELVRAVAASSERTGWRRIVVAESDANDPRLVRAPERGGMGFDGVWADDFHHCVHVLLTGETNGYYRDYEDPGLLCRAVERGFAYTGQYSPYRNRRHGAPAEDLAPESFVVCVQNHDQVGNRAFGDRLSTLVDLPAQKLAVGLLLCTPHVPLLFMGQEYGEMHPFCYFTSHDDPDLVDAVRAGRKHEFASFGWADEPPDPQAVETFERSRIDSSVRHGPSHAGIEALHRRMIALRADAAFRASRQVVSCSRIDPAIVCIVQGRPPRQVVVANLGDALHESTMPLPEGRWCVVLDAADAEFGGPGPALDPTRPLSGTLRVGMPPRWFAILRPAATEGP